MSEINNPLLPFLAASPAVLYQWPSMAASTTGVASPSGTIKLFPFLIVYPFTASNIGFYTVTGDSTSGHVYDVGFYSYPASGTTASRLCHIGAQAITNTGSWAQYSIGSSTLFLPGYYMLALTGNATTFNIGCLSASTSVQINVTTTTTTTGGALPGTIVLTFGSFANCSGIANVWFQP